ncbi:MAG: SMC-Scp complex subunit ScpB [Bacilli bacterium]
MNYKGLIEGLLFVVGDEGLTLIDLCSIIGVNDDIILNSLNDLIKDYENSDRGIRIELFGESYKLVTKKEYKEYLKKLVPDEEDLLTQSNLETLAIIAYNQPITRVHVDEIRGVNSSHVIRKLLMRDLICEKGRSDLPGRPILYGTTDFFLDYFGINSLDQLPQIELPDSDDSETNLFESKYKEN